MIEAGVLAALACACALSSLAGCSSSNQGRAATQAASQSSPPLAWTVNRAQATRRLEEASLEGREAAPGYQFVVLDVSVRNRDAGPQVLAEGTLIAMDESKLQSFDRPVTVLNDDYLSLQVLAPNQSLRGKIAYEVPEHLPGVLYWSPGNGSERILLNVLPASVSPRTLANADDSDVAPVSNAVPVVSAAVSRPDRVQVSTTQAREPTPASTRVVVASAPPAPARAKAATASVSSVTPPSRRVATVAVPRQAQAIILPTAETASTASPAAPQVDPEQARRVACEGLVLRDDPAEKARSLGFFAEACRDYPLPAHWQPPVARPSLLERASALLARVVVKPKVVRISDCSTSTSRADALVCGDPDLSAMDHQLAQSVARAREHVDDPVALQRDQDEWRGRVRNACDTTGCLEHVYGRRIAQVEAMVPRGR